MVPSSMQLELSIDQSVQEVGVLLTKNDVAGVVRASTILHIPLVLQIILCVVSYVCICTVQSVILCKAIPAGLQQGVRHAAAPQECPGQ